MQPEKITVQMLGGFSIQRNGRSVDDRSNRTKKVWLLLAYLICNRTSRLSQEHYAALLQGKAGEEAADPGGSLKALFYRARTMLDQLEESAGHELIVRRDGSYAWNAEIPLQLDAEEFEALCRRGDAESDADARLELYRRALELYRGDFLPKLSTESWVMPLSAYYHRLWLETVEKTLVLLEDREAAAEAAALCETALKLEPYSEGLYRHLMHCKLAAGDRSAVLSIYEEMSELLFSTFGVMPSDESRALYREAGRPSDNTAVPISTLREQLRETATPKGALFCEYDFFKVLYQAQARAVARSGDAVHIALFSVRGRGRKTLARKSLDLAVENLKDQIVQNLRQGDIVTQCSVSQLIVMLPQANYENSCAVCERLLRAFFRQYPHSPADIHYSIQPLEPLEQRRDESNT